MDGLHPRCGGLDVHKSSISACILLREAGRVQKHQRRFGAMTQDLRELAEWRVCPRKLRASVVEFRRC
jgi:transposase